MKVLNFPSPYKQGERPYDIMKNRMAELNIFVDKLVGAYKQKKQNEWDNEWQLEAINILEEAGNQKSSKNLLANVNPPEGYVDIEGATNWAKETMSNMSMVQQEEVITGELTPTSSIPKKQQEELIPDKMEWDTAFKMISELAPGKTDWSSLTGLFRKRIESGKAMGAAATSLLNMIMGQQPTDQRAELGKNIDMTHKYMSAFHPEEEEPEIRFDFESFLKENPDWQIKTINSKGDVTVGRKDKPKDKVWEFDTLQEAKDFINSNPQKGFTAKWETNKQGYDVIFYKDTGAGGGTTSKPNISKFLFGDTGIINDYIKGLIDDGMELADEDKELVIKNYNLRKHTLTEEELAEVELYFDQIGIDPDAEPKVVLPEGSQSKPKNWLQNLLTPPEAENKRDKYGYVLGEEKIGLDGKKYKYMGNDDWKPVY